MGEPSTAQDDHLRWERDALRTGLREAMSRLACGVTIVTTWVEGRPWGTTVSACCSLSMDPPLLLVCLGNGSVTTSAILEQGSFGVNILTGDQRDLATRAAATGQPKFLDDEISALEHSQSPVIPNALASIHCELFNAPRVGDHTIVVGRVADVILGPATLPLVYYERGFRTLAVPSRSEAAA